MVRPDVVLISPFPRITQPEALPSGVAWYADRLTRALSDEGMVITVIAPRVTNEPEVTTLGSVTIERRYELGPAALLVAARAAHRTGAPAVHLQHEVFLYGGPLSIPGLLPALAALRWHRRGPIVTMHQVVDPSEVDEGFTRIHRVKVPAVLARTGLSLIQRSIQSLASRVVVHEHSFGDLVPKSSVVPVGVDLAKALPKYKARSALGLDHDRLIVLCFGFLSPYKGLEAALEAAEMTGPAVEVVIAGGEHPRLAGRDPYADNLRRRYGASARFTGYVADEDVAKWFSAADVVLLPYPRPFASSGPLSLAISYGTPILCSPALAASAGTPATTITPIDAAGLARRLVELAANPSQLAAIRSSVATMAATRTWRQVALQHMAIYETVSKRRQRTGRGGCPG